MNFHFLHFSCFLQEIDIFSRFIARNEKCQKLPSILPINSSLISEHSCVSNYLRWLRGHWHNHMKFKFGSGFPSLIFRNTSKGPIVINGSGRQKKFTFSVGSKTSFNVEIVPHVNIIDQSATIIDICFFILP